MTFHAAASVLPISIHSLRVEGDDCHNRLPVYIGISIHSLRVEGDDFYQCKNKQLYHFNPLPPCGGRPWAFPVDVQLSNFNPLPPCGGRPCTRTVHSFLQAFQSTPSVWRETRSSICRRSIFGISIHSLRVEGDQANLLPMLASMISIHSLRVEGDPVQGPYTAFCKHFNPLPPCGGRPTR